GLELAKEQARAASAKNSQRYGVTDEDHSEQHAGSGHCGLASFDAGRTEGKSEARGAEEAVTAPTQAGTGREIEAKAGKPETRAGAPAQTAEAGRTAAAGRKGAAKTAERTSQTRKQPAATGTKRAA